MNFNPRASDTNAKRPGLTVGVVEGAIHDESLLADVSRHIPDLAFEKLPTSWVNSSTSVPEILILGPNQVPEAEALVKRIGSAAYFVMVLDEESLETTRRLLDLGFSDVIPGPLSATAVALCLERLIRAFYSRRQERGPQGEIVSIIKAGGGVGATTIACEIATALSRKGNEKVCIADLDLQFGAVGDHLDASATLTFSDLLGQLDSLAEGGFASALPTHKSGLQVLGAPKDVGSLDIVGPHHIDALFSGLRGSFATTILETPSVWLDWTGHALRSADRTVLVSQLTVPHMQLLKRQLRVLSAQKIDTRPLTLVLNAVTNEQTSALSLKAAEKAIGRSFDLIIPRDDKLLLACVNQGVESTEIRKSTKFGTCIEQLAAFASSGALAAPPSRKLW